MSEAEVALAAWGGGTVVRFLEDRENAVYEVVLADGMRAALRLHRVGYQSAEAIRSELWWMQALALAGVKVPLPVSTLAGDLVSVGARVATVIGWVLGAPLGASWTPLAGSLAQQCARFRAVGAVVAKMHNVTDGLELPEGFARHSWDVEGLLGEQPVWGRFWENPALTGVEREVVLRAREVARERLLAFAGTGADFGLIHADVLRENVLFSGRLVSIIDFDDCGFGFRMYDLASLASQNEDEPGYGRLMAAAVAGYRSQRALPEADVALLPLFLLLRRFASMGWVMSRCEAGDVRLRAYAERGVQAAKKLLDEAQTRTA